MTTLAGLAISENLKAQIRGLKQADRNAQDGVSLVQIAEGGLSEISSILIRLRELAVQAASDTIGPTERKFLNVEFEQLTQEVDRIANATEFNKVSLLNGTGAVFDIQIGTGNDPINDRLTFDASSADVNVAALGLNSPLLLIKFQLRTHFQQSIRQSFQFLVLERTLVLFKTDFSQRLTTLVLV